jgi:hypothetical protein
MSKKEKKKKEFVFHTFLVSKLRSAFRKTPYANEAKQLAKENFFVESKKGKLMRRVHYKCAHCGDFFVDKVGLKEIAIDHVNPVIDPEKGFEDWDQYIKRMFFGELQILCNYSGERNGKKSCHNIKTQAERAVLRETKKKKKEG